MSSFTDAFRGRLEAAASARTQRRDANIAMMAERIRRQALVEPVAQDLHRTIIRPMMEEVARAFPNCTLEHHRTPTGFTSRCRLARNDRFPPSAELAIGVGQAAEGDAIALTYSLGIIPELMSFTKSDSWTLAVEHVALEAVRVRIGDWLLRFTDTYLRLETEPNYQDWDRHIDPVCGMRISGGGAFRVSEHAHRKFYFCSDECRTRFDADPGVYLTGAAPLA